MAYFNEFPYTRTYDADLGWLIRRIQEVAQIVDNYVSLNSIQFADPINWDITEQYPRLTIVLDKNGNAFISRQPVPVGVPLTNEDYWTEIYSTQKIIDSVRENIAYNNGDLDTASKLIPEGDLFWYADDLYYATVDISAGTRFIDGTNCRTMTVDEKINLVILMIRNGLTQEIADREAADQAITDSLNQEITDREDADQAITDSLNQEIADRESADQAINERISNLKLFDYADIRNYGGVGDGVTNDTQAAFDCLEENNIVYLPYFSGCSGYVLDEIILTTKQSVFGDARTVIKQNSEKLFTITENYVTIWNLQIDCDINSQMIPFNIKFTGSSGYAAQTIIKDISVTNPYKIVTDEESTQQYVSTIIDNVIGYRTRNIAFHIWHAFAFLFMNKCVADRVTLQIDVPAFDFKEVEGLHLTYCESSGGYAMATSQTGAGFIFRSCKALWLDNCFSDYMSGVGYDFSSCEYIHVISSGASLTGSHGYRFLNCNFVEISNCYIAGMKDTAPLTSGVYIYNCKKVTMSACNIALYTYNGVYVAGGSEGVIVNALMIANTTAASVNLENISNSMAIGCVGDNEMYATGTETYLLDCIASTGFRDTRPSP